jgi:opacity protein-like surface antigen
MRLLFAFTLLAASAAYPQSVSFGLKGGVPLSNALKVADTSTYTSDRSPFVIGPVVELGLPLGLGVEADLLYRRLHYDSSTSGTTGQVWELPILAKYRFPGVLLRPCIEAGLSFRRFARLDQSTQTSSTNQPPEVKGRAAIGATVGAGLELKVLVVRLSSEIRYTRWGSTSIRATLGGLTTQLNQADFLLGITF